MHFGFAKTIPQFEIHVVYLVISLEHCIRMLAFIFIVWFQKTWIQAHQEILAKLVNLIGIPSIMEVCLFPNGQVLTKNTHI
jgi:hypothetical protein